MLAAPARDGLASPICEDAFMWRLHRHHITSAGAHNSSAQPRLYNVSAHPHTAAQLFTETRLEIEIASSLPSLRVD